MLQVEYRHDIQKNYLVIQGREEGNYMLHMLAGKNVQGFLPLEIREINNKKEYYYDITGRENISQKSNQEKWRAFPLKKCISQILTEIGRCREYLLNPDNLVLDPAYIYIDIESREIALCYVHDYNKRINEQLTQLFSYFMNVVDYQDKNAVQIVYKLYEKSREAHCTLSDLQKIVALETKQPIIRKIEPPIIEEESNPPQLQKNKKSLITGGSNRKTNRNTKENDENKSNWKNKNIYTKKSENKKNNNKKEKTNRNMKENIILTAIIQVALLTLLAVAAKSGIFYDEQRISATKSVMGLLVLGALDMFILGRVFAAEEEETENKENYEMDGNIPDSKKKIQRVKEIKEEKIIEKETSSFFQTKKPKENPFFVMEQEREVMKQANIDNNMQIENSTQASMMEAYQNKIPDFEQETPMHLERPKEMILPLENCNMGDGTIEIDYDKTIIQDYKGSCNKNQCYLVPETEGQELISLGEFPFFIGRFQKDTASLEKKKNISRMHSKIEKMGEQFFITDLNSTNGTFVNEKRLENDQRIVLTEGDKISFADIPYYFTKEYKAS